MFERFTENARRTIFFARYEASALGSPEVTPEHMLLGLLREYPQLSGKFRPEEIRNRISERFPPKTAVSTSVDMPLNHALKRVLSYAAQESKGEIHCGHLTLGLMREPSYAAELIRESGVVEDALRSFKTDAPAKDRSISVVFDPWVAVIGRFRSLLGASEKELANLSEADALTQIGAKKWARKEALGHLVDCATTHHRWIGRTLTETCPVFSGYPQREWAVAQGYLSAPWNDVLEGWLAINRLLMHALSKISLDQARRPCRLGIQQPITLAQLIERYVLHCESAMAEIVSFGHRA